MGQRNLRFRTALSAASVGIEDSARKLAGLLIHEAELQRASGPSAPCSATLVNLYSQTAEKYLAN